MDIHNVFQYALQREREGYRFFSDRGAAATHASVKAVFERLAKEELGHIAFIERQLVRIGAKAEDIESPPPSDDTHFSARAASEMIEQTTAEAMVPDLPVLRMAWLIEQDLAAFYRQASQKAEGEARSALERLAAWEEEHEAFFRSIHDHVMAEYSAMPWGG